MPRTLFCQLGPWAYRLSVWKEQCIVEDVAYIDESYASVVKFINMQLAG